jgi:DNA-binding MarR family transcriptional regulator
MAYYNNIGRSMTDLPLSFRVMTEIGIIDQLAQSAFERVLPDDLTIAQFGVLNHFARLGEDRSPLELARAFQVTKGTMTSTLQRLEAKGFVALKLDPNDGRGKRVTLTTEGKKARDRSIKVATPILEGMEAALGSKTLTALLPGLTKMRTFLETTRPNDLAPVSQNS